jgi:hypothetical protein
MTCSELRRKVCACAHQRIQHRYFGGRCEIKDCPCEKFVAAQAEYTSKQEAVAP